MRAIMAWLAGLLLTLGASAAVAQDPEPAPKASPPAAVGLPSAPIPYTRIAGPRRPTRVAARPTAAPVAARPPAPRAAGVRLAPGDALPPAELEAYVDGMVGEAMTREHIAGVAVSVVQNGQVVFKKGYGFADLSPRRPVDPDRTLFRIGSISKTFTWISVMKQVEAGRLRLDAPVNVYLPEKARIRDQGYDAPVRISQLMDHSGGFEDRALGQLFEQRFDRVRPLDLYLRQERPRRVREPGAVSSYSNYGAALAGLAAAAAARLPFEDLIERDILRPLGMRNTTFREPHPAKSGIPASMPPALAHNLSEGYRWTPDGFRTRPFEYISQIGPAGAASSTADDMAKYMNAILAGGQGNGAVIYSPRTSQAFRTPLRATAKGVNGWAHGFIVYDLPGGFRGYGHDGGTLSFVSRMVTIPALNLGVFIVANTDNAAPLVQRAPGAIVREFYGRTPSFPRAGSDDLIRNRSIYEGAYLSTRRAYSGLEGFLGATISGADVRVTPEGRLFVAARGLTRLYALEGPVSEGRFISADGDERLAFRVENGRATSFQTEFGGAAGLFERTPGWRSPTFLVVLAGLTAFAAVATLVGLMMRDRREARENSMQARAGLVQNIQALLWLACFATFGVWAIRETGDIANVMFGWPGPLLVLASSSALVAAILNLPTLAALPAVWQGGRRVDSWTALRKLYFTATLLIYVAFAVLLAVSGGLAPWSA
jgi:CubicO group peptidase (beta-lactamase class C family)